METTLHLDAFAHPLTMIILSGNASRRGRLFNGLLRLLPLKKRYASADAVRQALERPTPWAPTRLGRGVQVPQGIDARGWPTCRVMPAAASAPRETVVFLHGGGYFQEIAAAHWRFVGELARAADVACVVPIFPLAPRITAAAVVPAIAALLRETMAGVGAANLTVIANSSGGGLALAALQQLRDTEAPLPKRLVLISPWLDASVSRPEQPALARRDPVLDVPGLQEAGRLHAGALDVAHPVVSPLNGAMRGLPPTTVLSGTRDLLHPDSIDFARQAVAAGVDVDLRMREGLPHNFAFMPTPEGRDERRSIARLLVDGRA